MPAAESYLASLPVCSQLSTSAVSPLTLHLNQLKICL